MVTGNGLNQLLGQQPTLGQPTAHLRMVKTKHQPLRLNHGYLLHVNDIKNLIILLGQFHFHRHLADVVDQAGRTHLFGIVDPQTFGQGAGHHGRAQGMLPQLHVRALHELKDRGTDDQTFDNIKTKQDNGTGKGADLLGKSVKGGINELEKFGGQDMILADHLTHLFRGRIRIIRHPGELGDNTRQGGQVLYLAQGPTKFCFLIIFHK